MKSTIVMDPTFKADLETLGKSKIYFGHHSVGDNILEGLRGLAREAGIELSIAEERVGENNKPLAKFDDFARHAESPAAEGEQLMLMKLCYVDFTPDSDADALVKAYAAAVERVRKARPAVKIVHVTPPLFARTTDLKWKVKRMLGSAVWEDQANLRRLEFREQLLKRFPGEPVFDLAAVESTRPDGTREEYSVEGRTVPMLWSGYSSDGGHLNDLGKGIAAKAFAHALASALRQ